MKKMIIGGLVGGLILFVWQSLSWTVLNIHKSQTDYTSAQAQILEAIASTNLPEGSYFLPNVSPDVPSDQHQEAMMKFMGKPWATLTYHHKMKASMGMNLFRGFVINFLSVMLLCYVLLGDNSLTFKKVFTACLAVGAISYMLEPYLYSIWFQTNTIPDLLDAGIQWTLAGLFLAWYLPKK